MSIMTIGELKGQFSHVLDLVRRGQEIVISYGRKKEKVAVIIPYQKYKGAAKRKLGILEGKAQCLITPAFSMTDEELLSS